MEENGARGGDSAATGEAPTSEKGSFPVGSLLQKLSKINLPVNFRPVTFLCLAAAAVLWLTAPFCATEGSQVLEGYQPSALMTLVRYEGVTDAFIVAVGTAAGITLCLVFNLLRLNTLTRVFSILSIAVLAIYLFDIIPVMSRGGINLFDIAGVGYFLMAALFLAAAITSRKASRTERSGELTSPLLKR